MNPEVCTVIELWLQLNGKFVLHCVIVSCCREIFSPCDFENFICKLVRVLSVLKSLSKLCIVMCGSVIKRRMSSAKAAISSMATILHSVESLREYTVVTAILDWRA